VPGEPGKPLAEEDQQLLQAIAGHASVALENARLFTRMEQANRHWIEIFDAIGELIVAHDESDNVRAVNRSLRILIGVQPKELIGVNMSALLAMDRQRLSWRALSAGAPVKARVSMSIRCWNAPIWSRPPESTVLPAKACRLSHVLKGHQ